MLCNISRAQQEERLFSPGNNSASENPWTLFTPALQLPIPLYKRILLPLPLETCTWLTMVADPELQFSTDPE